MWEENICRSCSFVIYSQDQCLNIFFCCLKLINGVWYERSLTGVFKIRLPFRINAVILNTNRIERAPSSDNFAFGIYFKDISRIEGKFAGIRKSDKLTVQFFFCRHTVCQNISLMDKNVLPQNQGLVNFLKPFFRIATSVSFKISLLVHLFLSG